MYNSNNKRPHQQILRNAASQKHYPVVALHDLTLQNAESDSGFGSSLQTKSYAYRKRENFHPGSLMRSYSLSQLQDGATNENDQNNEMLNNSFCASQNTDPIMKELKECLAESENRRATLIRKLKEAQGTLQLQSDRLTKIELTSKGNNSMLNELKKKESDYKKRLSELEKAKHEKNKIQRENKHLRQEMQTRIANLQGQLKVLQSKHELCDSEGEKRIKLLEHSSNTIKILEEENYKLLRENGAGKTEIDIYKESLRLLKQRCLLLEEKNQNLNEDLTKIQEEKLDLQSSLERLEKQLIEESEQAELFQKENQHLANGWKNLTDEKDLIKEQLDQCELLLREEQSHLLDVRLQKDTLQHQLKESEIRNNQIKNNQELLTQDNFRLQDQLNALQHEITTEQLTISDLEETKRKLEEELSAVKKVCEELSGELCSLKSSYEQVLEKLSDLEKDSCQFQQKIQILEKEKKQQEQNFIQLKENLEEKKKSYKNEKQKFEEKIQKLKEELKYNEEIKAQQKESCTELEQKLQKTKDELCLSSSVQKEELSGWKNTCERLTGALNRKEKEIQSLADKCGDLEEVTLQLKVEVHSYQDQLNSIHRLKDENRRLLQEKQENEQLIQLIETEKEVLSRNAKRDLDNCNREFTKMELELDSQKQIVADLQQSNEFLSEKVDLCEKENEKLKESFSKDEISSNEENNLKIPYDLLSVEHVALKKKYESLLEKHECFLGNFNNESTISNKDLNVIVKEKEGLERQLDLLNGQISLIEGSKKRSEETVKKMEEELMKIKAENDSLKTNCRNETLNHDEDSQAYQTELERLKQELLETKQELQKQEESYKLLKQESLASVDHDLQQMRQELHKLMGVIEIKDQEIDNLAKQLKAAQTQIYNQEEMMKEMKETVQQVEKKTASHLGSDMTASISSKDEETNKQNGDHTCAQSLEPVSQQFAGVTLRSTSMVENLGQVDETAKSTDSSSLPNDERLQSLIAKYRSPLDQASQPDKPRVVGRPHSVGPGSNFSSMSRILGLTTPKPFYLSSAASKFNRFSGTPLGTINPLPPASTTASTTTNTTSSVPANATETPAAVSVSSEPSSTLLPLIQANPNVPKSPSKMSNRPPVPPHRPASRPSSAHIPEMESTVNGVMFPPSPAKTSDSASVSDVPEEVDANMIITI